MCVCVSERERKRERESGSLAGHNLRLKKYEQVKRVVVALTDIWPKRAWELKAAADVKNKKERQLTPPIKIFKIKKSSRFLLVLLF